MLIGVVQSKKVPRFLQIQNSMESIPVQGVQALWPDRSESVIYDLSLSGMSLSSNPRYAKLKLQQSMDFNLRVRGLADHVFLKGRLVRIEAGSLGFLFESMSVQGRLVLDQATKDQLILENIREMNPLSVPEGLPQGLWLHGPFDTNILMSDSSLTAPDSQVLVEYENLIWMKKGEQIGLQKSSSAVEENQSYFNTKELFNPTAKVSQGASWLDRLIKCMEKMDQCRGGLHGLVQWLRSQRVH